MLETLKRSEELFADEMTLRCSILGEVHQDRPALGLRAR
jgi:hypothetical protein